MDIARATDFESFGIRYAVGFSNIYFQDHLAFEREIGDDRVTLNNDTIIN